MKTLVYYSTRKGAILLFINREMYAGCCNTLSANGLSSEVGRKYRFSKVRGDAHPPPHKYCVQM